MRMGELGKTLPTGHAKPLALRVFGSAHATCDLGRPLDRACLSRGLDKGGRRGHTGGKTVAAFFAKNEVRRVVSTAEGADHAKTMGQ